MTSLWQAQGARYSNGMLTRGTGEAWAAAGCALVVLVAAGFCLAGLLDDLPVLGRGLLAVLAVVVATVLVGAASATFAGGGLVSPRRQERVVYLHSSAGSLHATRMHEAGHVVMTRRLGGQVRSVTINADGSGLTESVFPPWVNLHPVDELALDHAGAAAEGISFDHPACAGDRENAGRALQRLPWSARSRGNRQGAATAKATVGTGWWGPKGAVAKVARELPAPGTKRYRLSRY